MITQRQTASILRNRARIAELYPELKWALDSVSGCTSCRKSGKISAIVTHMRNGDKDKREKIRIVLPFI